MGRHLVGAPSVSPGGLSRPAAPYSGEPSPAEQAQQRGERESVILPFHSRLRRYWPQWCLLRRRLTRQSSARLAARGNRKSSDSSRRAPNASRRAAPHGSARGTPPLSYKHIFLGITAPLHTIGGTGLLKYHLRYLTLWRR